MINFGPYELQCKDGVPDNAVTKVDPATGDLTVLYIPTEKGAIFHAASQPYVLIEGGRGSAKSTTLRWDAHLRNLMQPGHRALLLRRTFPQLRGSHFARVAIEGKLLHPWVVKDFNQTKFFLEYANGSVLQFGHCESDAAILDYLSQEWDWIGFDELTTFTFDQFIRIAMSARTTIGSNKTAFVRGATNPIGVGASWVKRYFLDHNVSEEENPDYLSKDWFSIKANVGDNPHMDRQEYEKKLMNLPNASLRRAYVDGEWLVEGQFFSQFEERKRLKEGEPTVEWHVIQEMPRLRVDGVMIPAHKVPWIQIIRCVDWGYSEIEPGYCGWLCMMPDGTAILFKEWVFRGHTPKQAAERIKQESEGLNIRMTVGDPMMWEERVGESIAETMARNGVSMIQANNERENGWMRVHSWLSTTYNNGTGARPTLQFLAPDVAGTGLGAPYAIRTLPSLQTDPKKPKDTVQGTGIEDHAADAIRYWASNRPAPSIEPVKTLDWIAPELRAAMAAVLGGEESPLGAESSRRG